MNPPHSSALVGRYQRFVRPRDDGLPRVSVLLAFPALLLVVGIVLVAIGVNGTSSGALWSQISDAPDPHLLAGQPQQIRSDEWNVGTVWTIAQLQQGMPDRTATFPGGMDAAIPFDLPRLDWSIAFRPHHIGYLFLDVDQGTAWRWWSMGLSLIAASYAFALTVAPRRPLVAAGLAIAFFCSPFFQWWYQSTTFWPVVWGLVAMTALVWSVKSGGRFGAWLWAPVVAYLTVVMAMGIYAPFIIPVAIVVLAFGVGLALEQIRGGQSVRDFCLRIGPFLIAGIVGTGITLHWLLAKADTVSGFLGTVYPGARQTSTGTGGILSAARTMASSFTDALRDAGGFLGINSSEASTFLLAGAFLLPVAVWLVERARHSRTAIPWMTVALVAALGLFLAYTLVPGWDGIAQLLLLDRTTPDRARIGVGVAAFALLVVIIRRLDDSSRVPPRWLGVLSALLFLGSQAAISVAVVAVKGPAGLWDSAPTWWMYALATAVAIFLFARGRAVPGTIALVAVSVAGALGVNPVYVGVLDLRETDVSREVVRLNGATPGTWVGVGDSVTAAILLESGVEALNGTQGAPAAEMWDAIDPHRRYEAQWNRIGKVWWAVAVGEPVVTNPAADQIAVSFDACSAFAQANVSSVLSSEPISSPCLTEMETFSAGASLIIYSVRAR